MDKEKRSPLHLAAAAGHLDILFELLQSYDADIEIKDKAGR